MAEEGATGGIDAVGATAEIDLVEIKLQDLRLGELGLQGQGQDPFAELAVERAIVVQEHVARQLLGDGTSRGNTLVARHRHIDCADEAHGIHAGVHVEATVLDRDHGLLHRFRDLVGIEPFAVIGAQFRDLGAVARTHDDGLADLCCAQLIIAWQGPCGEGDRDPEEDGGKQRQCGTPQEQALYPAADIAPAASRSIRLGARAVAGRGGLLSGRARPTAAIACHCLSCRPASVFGLEIERGGIDTVPQAIFARTIREDMTQVPFAI